MARLPRSVVTGAPHHIVQRGHNRQPIVFDDDDRRAWLVALHQSALAQQVQVHAWVLLDDHFHLVATPPSATGLSRMMQTLGRRYVAWFNRRHGRTGTLWEGRFRASALEAVPWLLTCMRYVELYPQRAGLVADPLDHAWSSLAHHLGCRVDAAVTDHPSYWSLGNTPFERHAAYGRLVDAGLNAEDIRLVTAATHRGWPLGSPAFMALVQATTGHPAAPGLRGRPRKHTLTSNA